jgi:hypothetical protein
LFKLADGFTALISHGGSGERHEEWIAFVSSLTERVRNGDFPRGPNGYDPGLNRVQVAQFTKAGVPSIFLTPLEAELH